MDQHQPSNPRGYCTKKNYYPKTNKKEKKRRRSQKNMQQSSETSTSAREKTDQRESHGACVGNSVEGQMADGTLNCHVPVKENQRTLETNTDEFKQGAACSNNEEQSSGTSTSTRKETVRRESHGTHVGKTAEQQEMAEGTLQCDVPVTDISQRILESDLDVNNQNAACNSKEEQSSIMSTSTREKMFKNESRDTHVGIEGQEMADGTLNCHAPADNISQRTLESDMDENKQNASCNNEEEQSSEVGTSTREKTAKGENHDVRVEKTSEGQEIADGTLNCHVPDNISQKTLESDLGVENDAVQENNLPPSSEVKQSSVSISEEGQTSSFDCMDENKQNTACYNEEVQEDSHLPSSEENESSASTSKEGQPSFLDRRIEKFGEHDIFQLKKKNMRFPHAKFFCRLCNYHLDTAELCKKHWKEPRHSKLEKNKNILKEIKSIDAPSEAHLEALTAALQATVEEIALSEDDLAYRAQIADTVGRLLRNSMADVKVILYGSSLSGFGFHDSDVNLCIEAPEGSIPSDVLVRAWEAFIPDDPHFEDVQADFEGRFPCVRFKDKNSGLRCELCTGSMSACTTSQLLRSYHELDPRLHPLAMALRRWARICKLDCQSDGSLPAYAYVLITIYYLQRCEPPVLPVLQEEETLEHQNTDSLGALWIKMLQFYTIEAEVEEIVLSVRKRDPVLRDDLKISCRRLAIEDPIATNKKSIAKSLSSNIMFQYFMGCLQNALLYFGKPQTTKSAHQPNSSSEQKCVDNQLNDVTDCNDQESLQSDPAEKSSETIHSTPQLGETTESEHDCAQSSDIESSSKPEVSDTHSRHTLEPPGQTNEKSGSDSGIESSVQSTTIGSDSEINSTVTECSENHVAANEVDNTNPDQSPCMEHTSEPCSLDCVDQGTPLDSNRETESMQRDDSPQDFNFVFDEKILTGGKTMTVCSGCGKEGHNTNECPEDALPDLVELPPMKKPFMTKINALCNQITERLCLKDLESRDRDQAVFSYEKFIRHHGDMYSDAKLYLFGSSRNGFGFTRSDMDVCLKFEQYENAEELDIPYIIEDLAKKLKKNRSLQRVYPVSTAKVPIVKFVDYKLRLDVDISLYNCLAQANTHMLHVYSQMDPRVRPLVYTVKLFAKVCDIGDASKGSLSSYAFTLMAIFFLQQRKPPVLPVLQEIYDEGTRKPQHIIEGCNAWFCSDLRKLAHIWKGTNRESVGELWLGFLRFFTEEFNTKKNVVSIKQQKPLTRFEKMWTGASRGFAIEDPFDLDHNLGSGVSKKMAMYIMHVFINAREHFGSPKRIPSYFREDYNYFFDVDLLTGGELPPNDRCCKLCGKIGHFLKECPHRKGNRDANTRRDRDEDIKRRREKDTSDTPARDSKPNAARKPVASSEKTGQAPTNNVASGAKAKTFQPSVTYGRSTDTKPGPVPPSAANKMAPNLQHKQPPATSEKAPTTSKVYSKEEKYNTNPKTSSDNRRTKSPNRPVSQNNFRNMKHGVRPMTFTPRGQNIPQNIPQPKHDPRIPHQQMINRFPGPSSQQNTRPLNREGFQNVRREQQQSYNQSFVASSQSPPRDAPGNYVLFPSNMRDEHRPHPQWNMQNSPPNNRQFQARHPQQEPGAWQETTHLNRHVEQQQQHVRQDHSRVPQKTHPTQTRDNHVQSPPFSPERNLLNAEQHHPWATAQQPLPQGKELQHNQHLHYQQQGPYHQNVPPPLHQQPNLQNWQPQNSHPVPRQPVRFSVGQLVQLQTCPPNQKVPPNQKILTVQEIENRR